MKKKVPVGLKTIVLGAVMGLLVIPSGCGKDKRSTSDTDGSVSSEILAYEVLNTVDYTGRGTFSQQMSGTMVVDKQVPRTGDVSYGYAFVEDVAPKSAGAVAQVNSPPVVLLRNAETERLIGGSPALRNMGIVANTALAQIPGSVTPDGTVQERSFRFDVSGDYPRRLSYRIQARKQTINTPDDAVAVLAISEPCEYGVPGERTQVSARHKMLCVMDARMENVLYLCSRFTASAPDGHRVGNLRIESLMCRLRDGKPISLKGLDEHFFGYFDRLDLAADKPPSSSNTALPPWAMHSLAIRDVTDLVAGAAIEGKPNFAVCATVGLALLIDSAVSTGTSLLHEAGVIEWEWKGIPNYAGRGVGLGAAKGYEKLANKQVDEEKWKDVGGIGGDVASLFIPSKVLGTGVKIGTGGVKIIKGQQLAGKSLRISKQGVDLVRAGKGWQNSVKVGKDLILAKNALTGIRIGMDVAELTQNNVASPGGTPPAESSQYQQVKNASRKEMKVISATLVKLPQAQFDAFDVEFLRLLWLKVEDNNVLVKVVRTRKLSNRELCYTAEKAAFYDWNLRVLKEEGIMTWDQVRRIMNQNTSKGMKRP